MHDFLMFLWGALTVMSYVVLEYVTDRDGPEVIRIFMAVSSIVSSIVAFIYFGSKIVTLLGLF